MTNSQYCGFFAYGAGRAVQSVLIFHIHWYLNPVKCTLYTKKISYIYAKITASPDNKLLFFIHFLAPSEL